MELDLPAFRPLRGPAVVYALAVGYLLIRRDAEDVWVAFAIYTVASVWWLTVLMRASRPIALDLVLVWAPAVLPVILWILLDRAYAYSDAAAIGAITLLPFLAAFLIAPAVCALVLLVRRLSSPRRRG